MRNNQVSIGLFIFFVCFGCSRKSENKYSESEIRAAEHALIGVNRILVRKDHDKIKAFAIQNNLAVRETETGLWYLIENKGRGSKARKGQLATLRYEVSLLDGTLCYSSDSLGLKQFRIGQGGVESGLEEGVLMLRPGDKATFILPPHLAQGLQGDGDKIPARSVIVYRVELIKLEP
jgi:FKBP-type peptidyl-prolyl cis-trans isomerase FkpA